MLASLGSGWGTCGAEVAAPLADAGVTTVDTVPDTPAPCAAGETIDGAAIAEFAGDKGVNAPVPDTAAGTPEATEGPAAATPDAGPAERSASLISPAI